LGELVIERKKGSGEGSQLREEARAGKRLRFIPRSGGGPAHSKEKSLDVGGSHEDGRKQKKRIKDHRTKGKKKGGREEMVRLFQTKIPATCLWNR